MAGHSKWANIKHKKKINDVKKSKLFSKLANNIKIAIADSNKDINTNSKLKKAIDDALSNNMSKEIINNILLDSNNNMQEKFIYSSISNDGIIFIVECFDSNKNRIIGELRHLFSQYNMNLVPFKNIEYMFTKYSKIIFLNEYNDRYMSIYFEKVDVFKLFNNCIYVDFSISKNFTSELKKINILFESNIYFQPKIIMLLDILLFKKNNDLITKLNKLTFISKIFSNFKDNF